MSSEATREAAKRGDGLADVFHFVALVIFVAISILGATSGEPVLLVTCLGIAILGLLALALISLATDRSDISFFLLVPTIMSAFQNVYLSPFAGEIKTSDLQILIVTNWLYSVALCGLLALTVRARSDLSLRRSTRVANVTLVVVLLVGLASAALSGNDWSAAIASARNITSPMLFFLIGCYAAAHCNFVRYLRMFVLLGAAALVVAFLEYSIPEFWRTIGLPDLWEKKGIALTVGSGLPRNFYASEQLVPGEFLRRMAGPFADPVNFGTYLFVLIMAAWFVKSRLVGAIAVVAVVLSISKGAFVSLLVFASVWTRRFRSTFEFMVVVSATVGVAAYFYVFTQTSSTGSTAAHVNGLIASLTELPQHPLGRGFGGTGVLAGLLSEEGKDSGSAIVESGIGMVIGQLGVGGLLAYALFFVFLVRRAARLEDARVATLALALVLGFLLNAAFNEVALSPNSSAPYFIIAGLLIGGARTQHCGDASVSLDYGTGDRRLATT